MASELELAVVEAASVDRGYVAGFAITDQLIVAAGGTSSRKPFVIASSNARHFEPRNTPRELGLRDVLAISNAIWTCGEHGQLAVSRDNGASWKLLDTETEVCLFALAAARDGAVWVVGDQGYAARVIEERIERIDLATTARLTAVKAVRDEIAVLAADGSMRRWRANEIITVATGTTKQLTALAVTKPGTWIVIGDGGFVARSPDGMWFSRAKSGVETDLEAIAVVGDGRLVMVGDRGHILVSPDDGRTWSPIKSQVTGHLWCVRGFGDGALIGGDDGLILKLAPNGDKTWHERTNVFGGAKPLDAVFVRGPDGFIEHGLAAYIAAIGAVEPPNNSQQPPREAAEADDEDVSEDAAGRDAAADGSDDDAFELLGKPGTARDFETNHGVPLPPEAAHLFERVGDADKWNTFDELRLDANLLPDVGDQNLFELIVRRDQRAYLGTGLVGAFCGVFCVGSQGNADTYHLEIYEWNGPRQVLHWDHETASFSGVIAESLDSLVYLTALSRAEQARAVSAEAAQLALRTLYGKVAPTWHFTVEERDPEFASLDAKRRETEFFFYRARWILALLKSDGVTGIEDIPQTLIADLNQVLPTEQHETRLEMCEKYIPTALYSIWRAYLFDEPELARYLELGRRHRARLVRDATQLVDELHGGRKTLGTISDWPAHLAAFRALDLDPRRASARSVEQAARGAADGQRKAEAAVELERTPRSGWAELAWRWLDDGAAHRALLEQLDAIPEFAAQIAALDELRDFTDADRHVSIPELAGRLCPELEAILVGSLVREDPLTGTLTRPAAAIEHADEASPGWAAIDAALEPIYKGEAPHAHFGTVIPYMLGGTDPIHGISVYLRTAPVSHFHFVTYGFTDLFGKETEDPDESGFGFELTFRLARAPDDTEVPPWALNFLQNLGRYVFGTGNRFASGHKMGLNGPIALDTPTKITAILFTTDPELGEFSSVYGKAEFLQIVGITDDEYRLIQEWSTPSLVEVLHTKLPHLVTDLSRASILDDPEIAASVRARVNAEGSSEELTFAGDLEMTSEGGKLRIELGALYAASLPRAMRGRIRHGRPYKLRGRASELVLEPAGQVGYTHDADAMTLRLSPELAVEIEAQLQAALAGEYRFEAWPALELVVTHSFIRDQAGRAIEVRGIADPTTAQNLLDKENARVVTEADASDDDQDAVEEAEADDPEADPDLEGDADDPDNDDADLEDDADDPDNDGADGPNDDNTAPDPRRVRAALALTERGLRLAPDDVDLQFTHAMLLVDAHRCGIDHQLAELLGTLPRFGASVRLNVAVRLAKLELDEFVDALDVVLADQLPNQILAEGGNTMLASFGDVAPELFSSLGEAVLERAPDRMTKLVPLLPDDFMLISDLAGKALDARLREPALALFARFLAVSVPERGPDRENYLRRLNNACVQTHAAKAFETAARIADQAQPIAAENPYIYHSAACAYAALGDYHKALVQVKLAFEHEYEHLAKIEVDSDLGPLLGWPEFKALFRDWHARREGN